MTCTRVIESPIAQFDCLADAAHHANRACLVRAARAVHFAYHSTLPVQNQLETEIGDNFIFFSFKNLINFFVKFLGIFFLEINGGKFEVRK